MLAGIEELIPPILRADRIVLVTHIKPDGDALGSMFALADILRSLKKKVCCFLEEAVPHLFLFLPGSERTEISFAAVQDFVNIPGENVAVIALDCGDTKRLGKFGPRLRDIHPFLLIDHHTGNSGFGDFSWVEPYRSSTGEMVYDLAQSLGATFSLASATCLYTAIATDTGSFRYESTSSHTHRIAAHLVDIGARPGDINEKIYDSYSFGRLQLMQQVLTTLKLFADDRIAIMHVSREMLAQTGTTLEDTENFINLPRAIETVQVAVFLKEGDSAISVSLRSRGHCDVSLIAARFGGGGHARASGFRRNSVNMDEMRELLLPELIRRLDA